jgi:hypothetical protein
MNSKNIGLKFRLLQASGLAMAIAACRLLSTDPTLAKGGTAKPPGGTPPPPAAGNPPVPPAPVVPGPVFSAPLNTLHGFTAIGFIQNATLSGAKCPGVPASLWGGTATINGLTITIPCRTILQFPAATFSWADMFDPTKVTSTQSPLASLALPPSGATFGGTTFLYPSTEMRIEGNQVGTDYIAGLVYISQQSLNTHDGFIVGFDYANGTMRVGKTAAGPAEVRLQINDSAGRFSAGQTPDSRFNVDDQNPTIHAESGYPMCIPRTDPAVADDLKCPKRNRPKADANGNGCRNFAAAGVVFRVGTDFAPTPAGQFCTGFVMPDPATASATDPISTQQAPFEIGDRITYNGTVLRGDGKGPNGSDTISVHTITANLGIFTQPNTLPSYIAVGEFGTGTGSATRVARVFNGIPQEITDRLVLESHTTDVKSIVDVYMVDVDNAGNEVSRWLTPNSMTSGVGAVGSNGAIIDGGITTQFDGAQPGRARLRATKPPAGIVDAPSRYMRAVVRSLCDPANINTNVPLIGPDGKPVAGTSAPCLKRAIFANGLQAGTYTAPNFGFIFPENTVNGDPIVPHNFWDLPFLSVGDGSGQLVPTPW